MDLVRAILLACEAEASGEPVFPLVIDGYSASQIGYHATILGEAGLAIGSDVTTRSDDGIRFLISRLTWAGHEFLDAARDDTAWAKAKGIAAKAGGGGIEVLKSVLGELAKDTARRLMGLPPA
ncbi:MAG: uncharacterized protein JWO31_1818 [Phycisphaerales bacterium]|nr:uncharacterized protein [Phycisphaerales bacterium]